MLTTHLVARGFRPVLDVLGLPTSLTCMHELCAVQLVTRQLVLQFAARTRRKGHWSVRQPFVGAAVECCCAAWPPQGSLPNNRWSCDMTTWLLPARPTAVRYTSWQWAD